MQNDRLAAFRRLIQHRHMDQYRRELDSPAWLVFVRLIFALAFVATLGGIIYMPGEFWIKGYLAMGLLFTVGSAFTMAKTIRDQHEAHKLIRKIDDARTEKILHEHAPVPE